MPRVTVALKALLAATLISLVAAQPATAAPPRTTEATTAARYYEQLGPHQVTKTAGGPDHTLYYPSDLTTSTTKHPVVLWGNGTFATVEQYDEFLRHLASWGFVVAAANTGQSGSGQEMLAGGKFLIAENTRSGSIFQNRIDTQNIGAAGHSQGGGGAINAGADPMVKVTIPVQPGPIGFVPSLRGPSLFIAGQLDIVVLPLLVRLQYGAATNHPAVFAELRGAGHNATGEPRTHLIGLSTAWFRYWLAGDQRAKSVFFGPRSSAELFTDGAAWSAADRNAKADAVG
ncbi:acetylxylan esterase [Kribbella antibiotica]|uniref:Acetylxylan esterase n=1 Tax=Kribbella antibiotica TaxID=190195 RepID=A0A4R4ZUT0_9ACTN|nr:acetylxylan esterase [Kribbella antibiotica]TDD62903.1 acetylxylan esterase [Kribbella antibiotica]